MCIRDRIDAEAFLFGNPLLMGNPLG